MLIEIDYDESFLLNFKNKISKNAIAIDLGANIGKYTSIISNMEYMVYAFEPDPVACQVLYQNTKNLVNVTVIQKAVGDENKTIKLYRSKNFEEDPINYSVTSSVFSDRENINNENYTLVDQINFIDFINKIKSNIDILKIDIEGNELQILNGLLENNIINKFNIILLETHEQKIPSIYKKILELKEKLKNPEITSLIYTKSSKTSSYINWIKIYGGFN